MLEESAYREMDEMMAELKRLQADGKLLSLPELTAAVFELGRRLVDFMEQQCALNVRQDARILAFEARLERLERREGA